MCFLQRGDTIGTSQESQGRLRQDGPEREQGLSGQKETGTNLKDSHPHIPERRCKSGGLRGCMHRGSAASVPYSARVAAGGMGIPDAQATLCTRTARSRWRVTSFRHGGGYFRVRGFRFRARNSKTEPGNGWRELHRRCRDSTRGAGDTDMSEAEGKDVAPAETSSSHSMVRGT